MNSPTLIALAIPTPDGAFTARYSAKGLAELRFPSGQEPAAPPSLPAYVRVWHRTTTAAVQAALAGRAPKALPPLDLSAGTPFQRRVWAELRRIAPGQTRSYGELARRLGQLGAARAVGSACGANPIAILVPCHRVLAANGRLGGFGAGLDWKRKLLQREGI
jgi:O-6-methylguanine DNA methyltransferase